MFLALEKLQEHFTQFIYTVSFHNNSSCVILFLNLFGCLVFRRSLFIFPVTQNFSQLDSSDCHSHEKKHSNHRDYKFC